MSSRKPKKLSLTAAKKKAREYSLPTVAPIKLSKISAPDVALDQLKDVPRRAFSGRLKMLPVASLSVDRSYQRDDHIQHVAKIARRFSWDRFGALSVAQRGPDEFYVIDGQHRAIAASWLGMEYVPCIVYKSQGPKEESVAFADMQTIRRGLGSLEKFNAKLASGDPVAQAVAQDCELLGIPISRAGLSWPSQLMRLYSRNQEVACQVLEFYLTITGSEPLNHEVFTGLFNTQILLQKYGGSIMTGSNRKKLVKAGHSILKKRCHDAVAFYGIRGAKSWTNGILTLLNKGRQRRYVIEAVPGQGTDSLTMKNLAPVNSSGN